MSPSAGLPGAAAGTPAIELRGVSKRYRELLALEPLDLQIREGEFFCLPGPSGCGKTTTLNLLGGFVEASSGEILIQGERANRVPPHKRNVNTEGYPLQPPMPAPPEVLAALQAEDERRLEQALPGADEQTRFCYRWMLLDNLVHELNALRGALGEPEAVKYAALSPRVVNLSLVFGGVECHLSWVDLPGMARYSQELAFYGLDRRLILTLPSPYLRGFPSQLAVEGAGDHGASHSWRTVETVSYVEAFKRELLEFGAAIREQRAPRTDGIDGLHDVALCHAIARAHLSGEPAPSPSEFASGVRA